MLKQFVITFIIFDSFVSAQIAQNEHICGVKGPSSSDDFGIVGENDATPFEFPWQGALHIYSRFGDSFCGATILNSRWVITNGNCVTNQDDRAKLEDVINFEFVAGSLTLETDQRGTVAHVEKTFRHPRFAQVGKHFTPVNDVGLLKLKETLPLSDPSKHLVQICLPKESDDLDYLTGTVCTTTGWGSTSSNGDISNPLQHVNITIWKQASCAQAFAGEVTIDNGMICAADPDKDTCTGDDGGPLICYSDGKWNLIGLNSWGFMCSDPRYPAVFTRVTDFLPWIQETITNN